MNSLQRYQQAVFWKSVAEARQLPPDQGREVAVAGRSNSGKSSALNALTGRQSLARVSKTPGRTQLINFFRVGIDRFLVDLPGYGYARVSATVQQRWQRSLQAYLTRRRSLVGLILLSDVRNPLTELDRQLLDWSEHRSLPCHILLTKCDKLGRGRGIETLRETRRIHLESRHDCSAQLFSATKKVGLAELAKVLDTWFEWD